jgi:hypothetical protein
MGTQTLDCVSFAGEVLRMRVGGRNDHGPLNMGPKLQLSLEDAVGMQLQASRSMRPQLMPYVGSHAPAWTAVIDVSADPAVG